MSPPRRWIGHWAVLGCVACGDAERPRYVTEHLDVELYDGEVLCDGSLEIMDAQVERVSAFLGIDPPPQISVFYGHSAVKDGCGGTWGGCARASGVYATSASIFHELVHAVRHSQGKPGSVGSWLFEEGLAEVLSGFRWHLQSELALPSTLERGPAMLAALPRGEGKFVPEDYPTAGHFMSWLRTTYGDAALVAFLNDPRYLGGDAYEEAFAAHFGLSIAEADSAWRSAAATEYLWSEPCDPARALPWTGSTLEFSDTVDCEAPHTTGPAGEIDAVTLRSHCFTLAQPKMVRAEFEAGGGRLRLMPVDCVDTGELAPEYYDYKRLKGGETQELPLAACTWEVQVDGIAGLTLDFMLRLTQL
ncbi:hypothetical protein SAMN02745121_01055 [Nannocystis exedens]|uniref:Peptidase MA superfamily protein n=1 Tax=Nannocystis exedens TaxID=54 RepID=A0A1I1UGV9_9BACT|nr:hypothetical protein [Nannocystis exedens]PCC71510.1 hypothetical protein NAEX_04587 [Nannocystis exedens]SFD67170.1 hypothetical protein SAMN02745121_01055 [Nannocystis exedens]